MKISGFTQLTGLETQIQPECHANTATCRICYSLSIIAHATLSIKRHLSYSTLERGLW